MPSVLVLTAGLGTRLDPLTRLVAKAAMPLGRSTFIERVLTWLGREGLPDAVLNLHHRPPTIAAAVGDGSHLGLQVRYSWEPDLLGSAGGPRHALPLLEKDPLLIVNGDTLCECALAPMLDAHARTGAAVTMAVVPNPAPDRYGGLEIDDDDTVVRFVPRGQTANAWHFVGIQVVDRAVFGGLPDGVAAETVSGLYRRLVAEAPGRIRVHRVSAPWIDIGTPADYLAAALALAAADPQRAASTAGGVRESVVWPGVTLGARLDLERCIVAGGVIVPDGFAARDCVIVPAALARPGDRATIAGTLARFPLGRDGVVP